MAIVVVNWLCAVEVASGVVVAGAVAGFAVVPQATARLATIAPIRPARIPTLWLDAASPPADPTWSQLGRWDVNELVPLAAGSLVVVARGPVVVPEYRVSCVPDRSSNSTWTRPCADIHAS